MKKKIFCIGLNKTGTTSLHEAFGILGYRSVHFLDEDGNNIKSIIEGNYLAGDGILKGLEEYDAFSDWDRPPHTVNIVKAFQEQYPDAFFILNTRPLGGWLDSRERHVRKNQERKRKYPERDITWLEVDREAWQAEFENHYAEVAAYFAERKSSLLVFDVTRGDGWEKLCRFLDQSVPPVPFPKRNVSPR